MLGGIKASVEKTIMEIRQVSHLFFYDTCNWNLQINIIFIYFRGQVQMKENIQKIIDYGNWLNDRHGIE